MSLDDNKWQSPYQKYLRGRNKINVISPTPTPTPTQNKPKEDDSRICPNCKRGTMKKYLQPPSDFTDANGRDPNGFYPNRWYWICTLPQCGHKMEMIGGGQITTKGYKTKNSTTQKPLFQNLEWYRKKKRRGELGTEDQQDLALFGYQDSQYTTVKDERTFTYSEGGWH